MCIVGLPVCMYIWMSFLDPLELELLRIVNCYVGAWELNLGHQEEQSWLLTAELSPPLSPLPSSIYFLSYILNPVSSPFTPPSTPAQPPFSPDSLLFPFSSEKGRPLRINQAQQFTTTQFTIRLGTSPHIKETQQKEEDPKIRQKCQRHTHSHC